MYAGVIIADVDECVCLCVCLTSSMFAFSREKESKKRANKNCECEYTKLEKNDDRILFKFGGGNGGEMLLYARANQR